MLAAVLELRHTQNSLHFYQPELIRTREAWLERARRAHRRGWFLEDWAELEFMVAADAWAQHAERARIELAKDEKTMVNTPSDGSAGSARFPPEASRVSVSRAY